MKKELKGNLYSVEFFYELEKDGKKEFFTSKEIEVAIKIAIDINIKNQE